MKTSLATFALAVILYGGVHAQQPSADATKAEQKPAMPTKLGTAANLKKFNVTIRRFDPKKGLESGENFVLPVDSPDEEHAISSTLANTVSFTKKSQGSEVLSVAFCCVGIEERR